MESENGQTHFFYKILTANLLGLRNLLVTDTKGNLITTNSILDYVEYQPQEELFRLAF